MSHVRPCNVPAASGPLPALPFKLTLALGLALALALGAPPLPPPPAQAAEFGSGEIEGSLDVTLSHGMTFRVEDRDDSLTSANTNDGGRNYDKGLVSNTSKFTGDLEIERGGLSAFFRASGFYDFENQDGERESRPLSEEAKDLVGQDFELLDAYVAGSFEPGGVPVDMRLGKHVLSWGESTFIQNGVNVVNPFDVNRLRTPGSELREALEPVSMFSLSTAPTDALSVEGFYQLDWKKTEIDPPGTYFSTRDYVGAGADRAYIDDPALTRRFLREDAASEADRQFLTVPRLPDDPPEDSGQWGLALRYLVERLNDTEFGLFYVNYHSRLPVIDARYGTQAGLLGGLALLPTAGLAGPIQAIDAYGKTAGYRVGYPEDLQVLGLSFNTALGASGWALQGEYSLHPDSPLQRTEASLLEEGLRPITDALACVNPMTPDCPNPLDPARNPTIPLLDTPIRGYVERNVSQLQATATKVFGAVAGADGGVFLTEMAVTRVHGMPSKSETPLASSGVGEELADATSWGYRAAMRFDYNNAIGAARLSPYAQFQHDVSGSSPAPGRPFLDGRRALTLGVRLGYLESWGANVGYTRHSGSKNQLSDRDFVTASVSYSF